MQQKVNFSPLSLTKFLTIGPIENLLCATFKINHIRVFYNVRFNVKKTQMILFGFLLSSVFYIRRKCWNRENFLLSVFNAFGRFGMSWTRFEYFLEMSVCLSVCLWVCVCVCVTKINGKCSSRTNEQNFMKLYI